MDGACNMWWAASVSGSFGHAAKEQVYGCFWWTQNSGCRSSVHQVINVFGCQAPLALLLGKVHCCGVKPIKQLGSFQVRPIQASKLTLDRKTESKYALSCLCIDTVHVIRQSRYNLNQHQSNTGHISSMFLSIFGQWVSTLPWWSTTQPNGNERCPVIGSK